MDLDTEVETLSAIYGDAVKYTDSTLECTVTEKVEDNSQIVTGSLTITFTLPADYPTTLPSFTLKSDETYIQKGTDEIRQTLQDIIDTEFSCLFELVDKMKDMLIALLDGHTTWLNEEAVRKEKAEQDEAEKQFIGASKQTFEQWWKGKEAERKITMKRIKEEKDEEVNRKKGRITGKQFFMNNPRMAEQADADVKNEEEIDNKLKEQGVDLDMFDDLDV
ncbi:RWD domain containing protein, putative [Entamoeba invadens IP1]|uniref:RWD domain containing protein, putative n=1 Tax=Entamoeba invadens IP1 TaxID=370355 RepID=A0A0A1UA51_ENTIV|nr:RWD domain containing protein, putative [Entamoeba invadens IP1]ELP90036.1 RWD domain containing protein, putative [Entamoeba invadens IP1]|eukprot:XP_004256807.1 RWD domain containing protein, putative [Entamoeba invadens IP1]